MSYLNSITNGYGMSCCIPNKVCINWQNVRALMYSNSYISYIRSTSIFNDIVNGHLGLKYQFSIGIKHFYGGLLEKGGKTYVNKHYRQ